MEQSVLALFLVAAASVVHADTQWVLERSSLVYHISHPLHQSEGVSHAARGKGVCKDGQCEFLIAAPVKSFDSGDSNRDLHMLQATRGAEFPIISVRTRLPESAIVSGTIHPDIDIQFAGQMAHFANASLQLLIQGNQAHLTGTIQARLSDFKIDPPTLLAIAVKNEMPIRLDMTWRRE
jgi:hypothetical protein